MLESPFDIVSCSWPHPTEPARDWALQIEWISPLMPTIPQVRWELIDSKLYWTIHWSDFFQCELKPWDPIKSGEMRGFHTIFQLKVKKNATLVFLNGDGCVIRQNNTIVYCTSTGGDAEAEIQVHAGDDLEIAQRHLGGEWQWRVCEPSLNQSFLRVLVGELAIYLEHVQNRLREPKGPPLKMYTSGRTPIRTIVAIYSMVLNGYIPKAVLLFGEDQWNEQAHHLFTALLPFANIVMTDEVMTYVLSLGTPKLAEMAYQHWFVMKTCISLLYPPTECCLMDDDVLILDHLDDALSAFQNHNLVYTTTHDLSKEYTATWSEVYGSSKSLPTGKINGGLYWLRNVKDLCWLASQAVRVRPIPDDPPLWEQGFIATTYADESIAELSSQRYFFPVLDGLPGGVLGYDYKGNPCRFASIHFGGFVNKPTDWTIFHLAPQILKADRRQKEVNNG